MNPVKALDSILGLDDILALGVSTVIQVGMVLAATWRQTPSRTQVVAQTLGFYVTFGGNVGLRLQHRSQP